MRTQGENYVNVKQLEEGVDEIRRKYEKPLFKKEERMNILSDIGEDCRQCSSCHGCR
ncbi:hypothetical protein GOV13_03735 [Candidatus Pacearchaeota archaeon]|nr:hypothetical protein [Candidatus Pacearchaeota archaeon]